MPSGVLEKFLGDNSFYFTLTLSAFPQLNKKRSGWWGFFFVCLFLFCLFVFCTVGIGKNTVGVSGGKNISSLFDTERRLCLGTSLLTWVRFSHCCEHAQGDREQDLCRVFI